MKFLLPHLEMEFHASHPDARRAVLLLDFWSSENGLPEVVVTHVLRSEKDSEVIYTKHAEALLKKLRNAARLSASDRKLAETLEAMSDFARRKWAREKFSWHRVGAAVDIRNKHYTPTQLAAVMTHLRKDRPPEAFEILSHDVSSGAHIHIGRKDDLWKKTHETQLAQAKERKANV